MTVQEWLIQDRQWSRLCRIAHAQMKLRNATTEEEKDFWFAVYKANHHDKD